MIVLDASAVVEFLLGTAAGRQVAALVDEPGGGIAAPSVVDVEVAHAVRRWSLAGALDLFRAERAIDHLADLNVQRWPHEQLLPRIWELRHNLTAYDAAYVALAEALGATLITCDRSIAEAPGITCEIALIG